MSIDNHFTKDDYIKSLIIESYELMNNMIEFDKDNDTKHSMAIICQFIEMLAMTLYDMPPQDMAGCIYNIVCQATGEEPEQEGGDICEASFSKY